MPRARTAQDKRPVQIKLDNATADWLRIQAAVEGTTQSALIERAIKLLQKELSNPAQTTDKEVS